MEKNRAPAITESSLRIPLGILTDRFGGKKTAIAGQLASIIPLILGWKFANSMSEVYMIGLLLGVAGASFAVALPLASRWYPPEHQGLAMGIAGAGNSGTVLAVFFAPRLANILGWNTVFGLALIPMILMFLTFLVLAKDSPAHPEPKKLREYFRAMKTGDAWLFNFFYSITFGGFVGLASFLPIFFHDQYGQDKVMAGNLTALCVFAESFIRPIGGYFADRFGGVKVLSSVYALVGVFAILIATLPPLPVAVVCFFLMMLSLGSGNGSVFQLVPLRFKDEVGAVTGLVGAFGGPGGRILSAEHTWVAKGFNRYLFFRLYGVCPNRTRRGSRSACGKQHFMEERSLETGGYTNPEPRGGLNESLSIVSRSKSLFSWILTPDFWLLLFTTAPIT